LAFYYVDPQMSLLDERARHARSGVRSAAARAREHPAPIVAWTATFALTFFTTLGPVYSVRLGMGALATGLVDDAAIQVFFVTFYAALIMGLGWVRVYPKARRSLVLPLTAFFVVTLASTLWSVDPARTFTQAVLLGLTAAAGLAAGRATSVPSQVTAVFASQQLGAGLSLIAVIRHAPRAYDFAGRWAGIYISRNSLGPVAALGIIAAVGCGCLLWTRRPWRKTAFLWIAGLGLGIALAVDSLLLLKSGGLTPVLGLAVAAVGVGALVGLRRLGQGTGRAATRAAAITLAGLAGLSITFWLGRATFLPWVGKDATLDRRTILWHYLWHLANQRPLGGWGWLAVWRIVDAHRTMGLFEAHNGFLEAYLGTGLLGLVLVVAFCVLLLWQTARVAAAHDGRWIWPFALVLYALTANQFESFIGANLLPWVLLAMAAATIAPSRLYGSRARIDAERNVDAVTTGPDGDPPRRPTV
jgi:exopolysaccharide production protein ExoQ